MTKQGIRRLRFVVLAGLPVLSLLAMLTMDQYLRRLELNFPGKPTKPGPNTATRKSVLIGDIGPEGELRIHQLEIVYQLPDNVTLRRGGRPQTFVKLTTNKSDQPHRESIEGKLKGQLEDVGQGKTMVGENLQPDKTVQPKTGMDDTPDHVKIDDDKDSDVPHHERNGEVELPKKAGKTEEKNISGDVGNVVDAAKGRDVSQPDEKVKLETPNKFDDSEPTLNSGTKHSGENDESDDAKTSEDPEIRRHATERSLEHVNIAGGGEKDRTTLLPGNRAKLESENRDITRDDNISKEKIRAEQNGKTTGKEADPIGPSEGTNAEKVSGARRDLVPTQSPKEMRNDLPKTNQTNDKTNVAHGDDKPVVPHDYNSLPYPYFHRQLPNAYLYPASDGTYRDATVGFVHSPKSAGTTMKSCMESVLLERGDKPTLMSFKTAAGIRQDLLNDKIVLEKYYMGDSTLGICDYGSPHPCSYFTILREPYDRAVSHYYFCKDGGISYPPCNNTLEEFVLDSCSLFFRQMTVQFNCRETEEEECVGYPGCPTSWTCNATEVHPDNLPVSDGQRQDILQYVTDRLDRMFAVIGLAEEYETSLKMFQDIFGAKFYDLCKGSRANEGKYLYREKAHGEGTRTREEEVEAAKRRLRENGAVRKCLSEDEKLYNKAKDIFKKQLELYNRKNN